MLCIPFLSPEEKDVLFISLSGHADIQEHTEIYFLPTEANITTPARELIAAMFF